MRAAPRLPPAAVTETAPRGPVRRSGTVGAKPGTSSAERVQVGVADLEEEADAAARQLAGGAAILPGDRLHGQRVVLRPSPHRLLVEVAGVRSRAIAARDPHRPGSPGTPATPTTNSPRGRWPLHDWSASLSLHGCLVAPRRPTVARLATRE